MHMLHGGRAAVWGACRVHRGPFPGARSDLEGARCPFHGRIPQLGTLFCGPSNFWEWTLTGLGGGATAKVLGKWMPPCMLAGDGRFGRMGRFGQMDAHLRADW